jgi:hypothetical protein
LGIEVKKCPGSLVLAQEKYVSHLLSKVDLHNYTLVSTPLSTAGKLSLANGTHLGPEDSAHL